MFLCVREREREKERSKVLLCIRNSRGETKETLVVDVLEKEKAKTACVGWVCSTEYSWCG